MASSLMAAAAPQTNACDACVRSKRKCTRDRPSCHRCLSRGLGCTYKPLRPGSFVLLQQNYLETETNIFGDNMGKAQGAGLGGFQNAATTTTAINASVLGASSGINAGDFDLNLFNIDQDPGLMDLGLLLDLPVPLQAARAETTSGSITRSSTGSSLVQPPEQDTSASAAAVSAKTTVKVPIWPWFLAPDTWRINQLRSRSNVTYDTKRVMHTYTSRVKAWLSEWVDQGSNPFIHRVLYKCLIPECVQDAYSALALYLSRTPRNEHMVHHIISQRAAKLLAIGGVDRPAGFKTDDYQGWQTTMRNPRDAYGHLARVLALLIYQFIGFFDGDIQLRHMAEESMSTMSIWLDQLLESARRSAALFPSTVLSPSSPLHHRWVFGVECTRGNTSAEGGQFSDDTGGDGNRNNKNTSSILYSSDHGNDNAAADGGDPTPAPPNRPDTGPELANRRAAREAACWDEELQWHSWILAESIRRTWTLASITQCGYRALVTGSSQCTGRIQFTARAGLWEAPSSHIWWQRGMARSGPNSSNPGSNDGHAGFDDFHGGSRSSSSSICGLVDVDDLMDLMTPDEVDPFGQFLAEITLRPEEAERWGLKVHDDL